MPVISSSVLFLLTLWLVAMAFWLWLNRHPMHRFFIIKATVQSWCGMLSVLLIAFFLASVFGQAWALIAVAGGILLKGLHEIVRLYSSTTAALDNHKNTHFYALDGVLLGCLIAMSVSWAELAMVLTHTNQLGILLWVIFAVQFNDIGQYVMGKKLGHRLFTRKLAPSLSPKKTIEGAIFGTLLTAGLCLPIGQLLTPFSWVRCFGLAVLLGVVGIMGDLLESAVKRRHGVKDMGVWLVGHGGIMDRVDSLLISLPLFWAIYRGFLT